MAFRALGNIDQRTGELALLLCLVAFGILQGLGWMAPNDFVDGNDSLAGLDVKRLVRVIYDCPPGRVIYYSIQTSTCYPPTTMRSRHGLYAHFRSCDQPRPSDLRLGPGESFSRVHPPSSLETHWGP